MDEKTLKRLLRAEGAEADRPGRSCPDAALLSAYVEHGISDEKRTAVEAHLADCEACLGQVAFLVREPADPAAPVAPRAVARARDLIAPAPRLWRPLVLRWGSAVAGAACVVTIAILIVRLPSEPQTPAAMPAAHAASAGPAQPAGAQMAPPAATAPLVASRPSPAAPPPTVRNSATALHVFSVASPAENATPARQDLEFRWQPVPGSLYYEINVVTDDGTVVWQARVEGAKARPPNEARFEARTKYFVWVRAHLVGGETVKSAAVSFQIADR
jgi:hypothetical protein